MDILQKIYIKKKKISSKSKKKSKYSQIANKKIVFGGGDYDINKNKSPVVEKETMQLKN